MDYRVGAIATSIALMVLCTSTAYAQSPATPRQTEQGGGTGQGGMTGRGMTPGMTGPEMMRRMRERGMSGPMMRIIFALIDTDSDGTISLQEW